MALFADTHYQIDLPEVLKLLAEKEALLRRPGAFHRADDTFPRETTHRRRSWRCIPFPRIGLMLEGAHEIAFVRGAETVEARMRPGDMWFFPAHTHDDESFHRPCSYVSVVFFPDYTRIVIVASDGTGDQYPSPMWHHRHDARPPVIEAALAALKAGPGREGVVPVGFHLCLALWGLVGAWLGTGESAPPPPRGKADASWQMLERFIQDNYHRPIDRRTAADALQLHPNRISELCRRFGGDTFQHILEKKRLDQAKRFLEKSNVKIEAVALMCGFSGVTYFTRVFGRSTGMSPGKWRGGTSRRELPQRNEPR